MQLTQTVAARVVSDRLLYREFDGLPAGPEWTVKYADVKCPTLRAERPHDCTRGPSFLIR